MRDLQHESIAYEYAKLAQVEANIITAWSRGLISEHDRDERIARYRQITENGVAYVSGQKRPRQRIRQPLDDPDAGKIASSNRWMTLTPERSDDTRHG